MQLKTMQCIVFLLYLYRMDDFAKLAEEVVLHKIRSAWHEIARVYNEMASEYGITLSMGFVLLTLYEETGTPVTKIAPRMGMEPNSLSRTLKSMEDKGMVLRKKDKIDKRKVYICVTEHGAQMRKIALKAVYRLNEAIVKDVPPTKLQAFFEVINQVSGSVEKFREDMHSISQEKLN